MRTLLRHIVVCAAGVILLLGVPFLFTDGFRRMTGGADAVSGASVIIDQPSGNYTVLINRERHKSESDMEAWREYFSGGDFTIIFDDISCVTLAGDSSALTMAQSFMSRLPENQMKVTVGNAVAVLSKAEYGRFDMILMSDEAAGSYGISGITERDDVEIIHMTGKGGEQ